MLVHHIIAWGIIVCYGTAWYACFVHMWFCIYDTSWYGIAWYGNGILYDIWMVGYVTEGYKISTLYLSVVSRPSFMSYDTPVRKFRSEIVEEKGYIDVRRCCTTGVGVWIRLSRKRWVKIGAEFYWTIWDSNLVSRVVKQWNKFWREHSSRLATIAGPLPHGFRSFWTIYLRRFHVRAIFERRGVRFIGGKRPVVEILFGWVQKLLEFTNRSLVVRLPCDVPSNFYGLKI